MADTKISALTATTTVADADEYAVASSGASKKITGANLKAGVLAAVDAPTQAEFDDHSARHESGGADSIKLDNLAAPDDNTDLNASTGAHGLLKKLDNDASHYMDGTGAWSAPGGGGSTVYDYVQLTSSTAVSSSNSAAPTTLITGNSVAYSGSVLVSIEIFLPAIRTGASGEIILQIWEDSTNLGDLCAATSPSAIADYGGFARLYRTPSAGSHTYYLKGYFVGASGSVRAGTFGGGSWAPAHLRVASA